MSDPRWLQALRGTSSAKAVEGLCGSSDGYVNSALLEVRNDLGHMIRRLNNLALFHGVEPASVEKAKQK